MSRNHSILKVLLLLIAVVAAASAGMRVEAQPCISPSRGTGESEQLLVPSFLNAWIAKYPTSTLPARMDAITGRDCNVCHHPPNLNTPGNCYRSDLADLMNLGMAIEDALNQLDGMDSDGDGISNGQEAVAARPEAGEYGYNPGLIGDQGTDPCGTNPGQVVTGMPETPPPAPVPTVSEWGVIVLMLLLLISASLLLRKKIQIG